MDKDPRYKSGTCLTKTDKEDARDFIIDNIDVDDTNTEQEILEKDLMKMSTKSLKIIGRELRKLINEIPPKQY